jgi:hypothetical protein
MCRLFTLLANRPELHQYVLYFTSKEDASAPKTRHGRLIKRVLLQYHQTRPI